MACLSQFTTYGAKNANWEDNAGDGDVTPMLGASSCSSQHVDGFECCQVRDSAEVICR